MGITSTEVYPYRIAFAMHIFIKIPDTLNAGQMYCEVYPMAFKIPSVPPTTNKTIRFPNDLIESVEGLIQNKDCTFSAFVIAAVRAAVEEVEQDEVNSE